MTPPKPSNACRHGVLGGTCERCEADPIVVLTEAQVTQGVEAALEVLESLGIPRKLVILGITSDVQGAADTPYDTHVGAAERSSLSSSLSLMGRDLYDEARRQSALLADPARCPSCSSRRWGVHQGPGEGTRALRSWRECMSCGHKAEK